MKFNIIGSNEDKQRSEELQASMSHISGAYAFKHIMGEMDRIVGQTWKDEDSIPTKDLTGAEAAYQRGIRRGLGKLKGEIQFILHGGGYGRGKTS